MKKIFGAVSYLMKSILMLYQEAILEKED